MTLHHEYATEPSTRAQSLGHLFLRAAERHDGAALRYKRDGGGSTSPIPRSAPPLVRSRAGWWRSASSPATAWRLSETRPEWTLATPATCAARRCSSPSIPPTPPRSAVRARALRGARGLLRGRDAGREGRARSGTACPALEHVIVLTGEAPARCRSAQLRAGRPRRAEARVDDATAGVGPRTSRRSSTRRAPPARRRAACSRIANWTSGGGHVRRPPRARRAASVLPVPAARARDGEDRADVHARHRRDARLLAAATRTRCSTTSETRTHTLPAVPRLFEKIHTAASVGIAQQSAVKRRAVQLGAAHRPRGARARGRGRAGGWLLRAGTHWPTGSCCRRSAPCSATGSTSRSRPPRRSPRTSSTSSTPPASGCSRPTG